MVTVISIGEVKFSINNYRLIGLDNDETLNQFDGIMDKILEIFGSKRKRSIKIDLSFDLGCLSFRCMVDDRLIYCPALMLPLLLYACKEEVCINNIRSEFSCIKINKFLDTLVCTGGGRIVQKLSDFVCHFRTPKLALLNDLSDTSGTGDIIVDELYQICKELRIEIEKFQKYDNIYGKFVDYLYRKLNDLIELIEIFLFAKELPPYRDETVNYFFKSVLLLNIFLLIFVYGISAYVFENKFLCLTLVCKAKEGFKSISKVLKKKVLHNLGGMVDKKILVKLNEIDDIMKNKPKFEQDRNSLVHPFRDRNVVNKDAKNLQHILQKMNIRLNTIAEILSVFDSVFSCILDIMKAMIEPLEVLLSNISPDENLDDLVSIIYNIEKFKPSYIYDLFRWFYDIYCNLYCLDILSGCYL